MARKRTAGLKFRTKLDDGTYTTQNAGVVLSTDWEGNYSLILEIDTDEKTEEGYPVRAKLAAGKFVTPDGTDHQARPDQHVHQSHRMGRHGQAAPQGRPVAYRTCRYSRPGGS